MTISFPFVSIGFWAYKNFWRKKQYFFVNFYFITWFIKKKLILTARTFVFLQLIQITLKIDNFIMWEWKNVFWMTWIILVTIGFYLIGLFILLLLTSYYTFRGDADAFQLKGLIWCFSNICNFSLGLFFTLISMIKLLNVKEDCNIFYYYVYLF